MITKIKPMPDGYHTFHWLIATDVRDMSPDRDPGGGANARIMWLIAAGEVFFG